MTRRPGGSDGPEDVDAAFAEIVADLEREGLGASMISDDGPLDPLGDVAGSDVRDAAGGSDADRAERGGADPSPADRSRGDRTPVDPSPTDPIGWRVPDTSWEDALAAEEEGHYVPPEPPPLPKLRAGTLFGILLMAVGVLLLAGPGLIGLAPRIATPLALVSLAAGVGWLVLRMRQGPPPDSGWDDGAQL